MSGGATPDAADPWAASGVKFSSPESTIETSPSPRDVSAPEAFGNEAAQSATFGLSPVLHGVSAAGKSPEERGMSEEEYLRRVAHDPVGALGGELGSLVNGLKRLWTGESEASQVYRQGRADAQKALEEGREQHPYASFAGGLAGAAAVPLPGLGPATLGGRIARGAIAGGAGGAAYGAGSALSEGKDLGDIGTDALIGGGLGAVTGGAFGGAFGPRAITNTPGQRAAQTAADLGAPIPRGLASDSHAVNATTAKIRSLPIIGSRVSSAVDRTQHAAGEHIEDIIGQMGGITDRAAADAVARPGLQTAIDANRTRIDANYDALRNQIDQNRRFSMPRTQATLARIRADRAAAGWPNAGQGLEQFENVANGATFNGAHRARVDAREAGNGLVPHPGYNSADYNRLTRAMTGDLRDMVSNAALPNGARRFGVMGPPSPADRAAAVRAFDQAETEFGPLADANGLLRRLIDSRGEGAIATLLNATKEKGGNVALLAQLKRTMNPHDFQVIGGQLLHELGHNNSTGGFSLAKFVTGWDKTADHAKSILFSPQHLQNINDIVGLGSHIKSALRESNTSHTAGALILFDVARDVLEFGAAAAAGTLSGATLAGTAMAIPAVLFSHWLSGPATASSMAAWSRARVGLLGHPTPARLATFNIATRNLANNLGVPVETILKRQKEQDSGKP
jgi:hypothetical protein